ncbi:MAG TPA: AAA family ATPase [Hyphomonadaceae bacterium]|nr:AAA family ATPase [Hyphomonadaceae bacterium]
MTLPYIDRPKRGFVLGKFMPPHAGHLYLCDFGRAYVGELTILVCSLPDDPIPGELRFKWMKELCPSARVVHCQEILPQQPEDDPENFWPIWREVVKRHHPEPIDVVFASEPYGHRLAAECGARFVPVDEARTAFPVSATAIRNDPYSNWRFLPGPVRPYYLKRVALFGAESTGKTTLGAQLARHFDTVVAPEFGRFHTEAFGAGATTPEDMRQIVMGHLAGVAAASLRANRVLIEDTDPVLTAIWSDILAGTRDPWFDRYTDYPDLYLFCDIDLPWVDDGTRYFRDPEDRRKFHLACKRELDSRGVPYVRIQGTPEIRRAQAILAVESVLKARL